MVRYIVSIAGKKPYITKYSIYKIDNIIRFGYDIHIINNNYQLQAIKDLDNNFRSNPESTELFNNVSTEKKFSASLSQLEVGLVIKEIEKTKPINNVIHIQFPKAQFFYEEEKALLLYNFLKHFYDNYELIKLELSKQENSENENNNVTDSEKIVINEQTSSDIFNKLIQLCPNNISTFFILKHLSIYNKNQYIEFDKENNKLLLSNFTTNYMLFFNDLKLTLNSLNNETIDIVSISKTLVNGLNYLITLFINEENHKYISKNEFYLYINFNILLLYTYYCLYKNNSNILKVINGLLKQNNINITIEHVTNEDNEEKSLDLQKINLLAQKYNYLIYIDRENFIKSIIREYDKDDSKFQPVDLTKGVIVNKPSILNLENFEVIKDERFKNNIIIDRYYHQLLFINSTETIIEKVDIDYRLSKLIDLINNKIIPNVDKRIEMIQLNPSTLLIYNEFIGPFIQGNEISIDEILFLIFNITIPYIYDTYKIEKFIDYFH